MNKISVACADYECQTCTNSRCSHWCHEKVTPPIVVRRPDKRVDERA